MGVTITSLNIFFTNPDVAETSNWLVLLAGNKLIDL